MDLQETLKHTTIRMEGRKRHTWPVHCSNALFQFHVKVLWQLGMYTQQCKKPMQWFISWLNGKGVAGAAIFSILAPRPSDPAALWDGMSFSYSSIFLGVICGMVNCGLFTPSFVGSLIASEKPVTMNVMVYFRAVQGAASQTRGSDAQQCQVDL